MARVNLTPRYIESERRVPEKGRKDFADSLVPGLALRVSEHGSRNFVLIARYPANPRNPTRRSLGNYGELTLEQARDKARAWLALINRGIDPKIEEARERAGNQRRQVNTFGAVAAAFLERHAATLRKADEAHRIINGEFVKRWRDRPATDILPDEVAAAVRVIVARGAPYQAHNALGHLRRLYSWAIGTHEFGIQTSPVERLRPKDLIGNREARDRILTDDELRAVWSAAGAMGWPYGPVVHLLILTGQRVREVADASWPEFDLGRKMWTIPSGRMKGGRSHQVPLSDDAASIVEAMPQFAGNFVFTTAGGQRPVNGFSKAKARLDRLSGVDQWKLHDLRRTMRTHLSALPVQDLVRELVIAHAKPGLHRVYDLHSYEAEKRHCLQLWAARLNSILHPAPPTVANLDEERSRRVSPPRGSA